MKVEDVAVRVESVFAEVFGDRLPFKRELTRTDNDYWTSLKHMEFLIALEVEFGLRFDGADAVDGPRWRRWLVSKPTFGRGRPPKGMLTVQAVSLRPSPVRPSVLSPPRDRKPRRSSSSA